MSDFITRKRDDGSWGVYEVQGPVETLVDWFSTEAHALEERDWFNASTLRRCRFEACGHQNAEHVTYPELAREMECSLCDCPIFRDPLDSERPYPDSVGC